jgi:hypothetical protein
VVALTVSIGAVAAWAAETGPASSSPRPLRVCDTEKETPRQLLPSLLVSADDVLRALREARAVLGGDRPEFNAICCMEMARCKVDCLVGAVDDVECCLRCARDRKAQEAAVESTDAAVAIQQRKKVNRAEALVRAREAELRHTVEEFRVHACLICYYDAVVRDATSAGSGPAGSEARRSWAERVSVALRTPETQSKFCAYLRICRARDYAVVDSRGRPVLEPQATPPSTAVR